MALKFLDFDLPEVKRFRMPGVLLTQNCISCKKELTWDGASEYLMYPCNGGEYTIAFWCEDCDVDTTVDYKFDFVLTVTQCPTGKN